MHDRRAYCLNIYRELSPPAPLKGALLCLWTQSIASDYGGHVQRVMPDACIDMVFVNHAAPVVVGPWTESFLAPFAPGTHIVGARFHPGAATWLLGPVAHALLNRAVSLRALCGTPVAAQFAQVTQAATLSARRSALESALLGQLGRARATDQTVCAAIAWLARHPDGRVQHLSRWTGISGRQMSRRFVAAVGYGPKTLQAVLRFQRLLHIASQTRARLSLVELAMSAGYADQAHMTREVRRFAGRTPTQLLPTAASTLQMSDLFKTAGGATR